MEHPASLILVLAPPLLILIWYVATYNRFVRLRNHLRESWADIDVELKRRYELIPNLVETVQGYTRHERETLEKVVELRNRARSNQGRPAEQAVDESALLIGLGRVFALAESYPQLRSDAHFLALQKELRLTEDRIAASRRFYNGNVRDLRSLRSTFPSSIVASLAGVEEPDFFELDSEAERVVPAVAL